MQIFYKRWKILNKSHILIQLRVIFYFHFFNNLKTKMTALFF